MKTLVTSVALAGVVALLPNPRPADAEEDRLGKCLLEAVSSCDKDFAGYEPYTIAARGYCYLIRTGMCYAMDR